MAAALLLLAVEAGAGGLAGTRATMNSPLEMVKEWERDHCIDTTHLQPGECVPDILPGCDNDNIDAMPRVWFDQLSKKYRQLGSIGHAPSRAQVGPALTSLKHTCTPYFNHSKLDGRLEDFNANTWIEAPVVLNETHVYALSHLDSYNGVDGNGHYAGRALYSSLLLHESTDGGATFHPVRPPPGHLVATSPYDNRNGSYGNLKPGLGMPSSVLKDPKSQYWYVMAYANWGHDVEAQKGGQCLLRTDDISDPASWRAWSGPAKGFSNTVNVSPVLGPVPDPDSHTCEVLLDNGTGKPLGLRHISLVWSTYFNKYLAFGGIGRNLAFSVSDDLITWSTPSFVAPTQWNLSGNSTITPIDPPPGRWIIAKTGPPTPYWVAPADKAGNVFKYHALIGSCDRKEGILCPGMEDVCKTAVVVNASELDAIPTATEHFTCAKVFDLRGYWQYPYATLVDDTHHRATGADPSLNVVGQDAKVFFVGSVCAGTHPWNASGSDRLECTIINSEGRAVRDILMSTIHFEANVTVV